MAINSPNVLILDAEDASVTRVGSWSSVGDAEAVGGSYLQSNMKGDYLQFTFKGSALWVRFKFDSNCGKASVTVDNVAYPTLDLYSVLPMFKYVNVAVGLDENVSHTVKIGVAGEKNPDSTDYYVNVDAFTFRTTEEALSLQSIEYIDLINVINKINRIGEIQLLTNISNIDLVKEISLIRKIVDAPWIANLGVAMNGGFETGNLAGWCDPGGVATVTDAYPDYVRGSKYCCNLKHSKTDGIIQYYYPPIPICNVIDWSLYLKTGGEASQILTVELYFTDGDRLSFSLPSNSGLTGWIHKDVWASLLGTLQLSASSYQRKRFYCVKLRNDGPDDMVWVDDYSLYVLSSLPLEHTTLNDVSVTVNAGGSGSTPYAGTVKVAPGQIIGISLEYQSGVTLYGASQFQVRVEFLNKDLSLNESLTFTPPERPGTTWLKYFFYVQVPQGVAYIRIYGYFVNGESSAITISMRNITVFPTSASEALKPSRSAPTQDLSNYSLAGGATVNIDKSGLDGWSAIALILSIAYNASAATGIRVRWLYSPDGTNFDSPEEADSQGNYYEPTFSAGATRQTTILVPIFTPNVRITTTNKDSTYAHTLNVWTLLMR
jgi:hypothetical protein